MLAIPAIPIPAMLPMEPMPPDMKLLGGPILRDMRLPAAPNIELWFMPDMYGLVPIPGGYLGVRSISDDRLDTAERDSEGRKG